MLPALTSSPLYHTPHSSTPCNLTFTFVSLSVKHIYSFLLWLNFIFLLSSAYLHLMKFSSTCSLISLQFHPPPPSRPVVSFVSAKMSTHVAQYLSRTKKGVGTPQRPNTSYQWTGHSLEIVRPGKPTCELPGWQQERVWLNATYMNTGCKFTILI